MKRKTLTSRLGLIAAFILALPLLTLVTAAPASANPVKGSVNTTDDPNWSGPATSGNLLGAPTQPCTNGGTHTAPAVNCNQYLSKTDVFLSGTPNPAALGAGTYFFTVLVPGGQPDPNDAATIPDATSTPKNLSDDFDAASNREFSSDGTGTITPLNSTHAYDGSKNVLQVAPFSDTTNLGGVYILAACQISKDQNTSAISVPTVDPRDCKYDAFKAPSTHTVPGAAAPTVTKDATPTFTRTCTWTVTKTVDGKTAVSYNITGTTKDLSYEVVYTKSCTDSDWKVEGNIDVFNPNPTRNVTLSGITDQITTDAAGSDPDSNASCSVDTSGGLLVAPGDTLFPYTCTYSAAPAQNKEYNTASITWGTQSLQTDDDLAAGNDSWTVDFKFDDGSTDNPTVIHDCVTVSDNNAGNITSGTAPAGETICRSTTYDYTVTVTVPHGCVENDNTATFTATDDSTYTVSASTTAQVCRVPLRTGASTMGYWQNKNGQGIIKTGASTSGVCNSGTWLRSFAPFQDLSNTASCSQVATYVYNVIKLATCSGPKSAPCNAMLKAQDLATSLDVYFSDGSLGGNKINAPAPIGGVMIDLTQVCNMLDGASGSTCTGVYQDARSAFGNSTCLYVYNLSAPTDILRFAASQSAVGGVPWYGTSKTLQVLAKNVFDSINNQQAFGC